jgi:glycosyltransferase involved in cell wall biosynthesis
MVVHAYYPIGEPRVQREAEALIDSGYQVDVICLHAPGEPDYANAYGVNIYRLPVRRHKDRGAMVQFLEYLAFFWLALVRLTSLHLRHRYQTVQTHNPPDFLVFAALGARLMGARIILDLHDLMPEFYASRFKRGMDSWPVRLLRWQERLACGFADQVITVTQPWGQTLIERGLPADKCSIVMNVADNKLFDGTRTEPRPAHRSGFHLFYHGSLTWRYGVDLALQALACLHHDLPDAYLTIHGRGDFLGNLQQLARELALDDLVDFSTEYVPMERLPALIASADLALVPYRCDVFTGGILPTKLMEYAAMGIPALVARTPVISAYFDETMVEFFTPENIQELVARIRSLYHTRARLDELARNICKFNQRHNWASQKTEYVDLVRRLALRQRQVLASN